MFKKSCLFALFICLHLPAYAADGHPYDSPNIFGQAIWIGEGAQRYPALYAAASAPKSKGVVILLHAEGEHPQWPMVIQVLREYLTDHGWSTLALQLPRPITSGRDLDTRAYAERVAKQLQMAVDHIMPMEPPVLVLLGQGLGANVVLQRAARRLDPNLMAVVGIGINADGHQPLGLDTLEDISQLTLPILDVYAERDRYEVLHSQTSRLRAAHQSGNKLYRLQVIPGADSHYYNHTAMLASRIKSWLDATYRQLPKDGERMREALQQRVMEMPSGARSMPAPMPPGPPMAPVPEPATMPGTEMMPATAAESVAEPGAEPMPAEMPATPMQTEPTMAPNPTGAEGLF